MARPKKVKETVAATPQEVVATATPKEESKPKAKGYKVRFPFTDKYNCEKQYAKGDVIEGWKEDRLKSAIERGLIIAE